MTSLTLPDAKWRHWPETEALLHAFISEEIPIRFVGGCVRDTLLGRKVRDVDLATPLPPDQVMQLLEHYGIRALPTGIDHGTVTALVGERTFEITTLRRDAACDGRHAEVTYTEDWQADARRRDFTINAFSADVEGRIYDYCRGQAHLEPLQLVFIGNPQQRIEEDALRILRYFRFCAQLGIRLLDSAAFDACARNAHLIDALSGERIAQEMFKLLAAPPLKYKLLQAMQEAGLLTPLLLPPPPRALKEMLDSGIAYTVIETLSVWLLPLGDTDVPARMAERWRLSNEQTRRLLLYIAEARAFDIHMEEPEIKCHLRWLGREDFTSVLRIVRLWYMAEHGASPENFAAIEDLAEYWEIPEFPLKGQDLLDVGFEPGRQIGDMLTALEAYWEECDYTPSRQELIELAKAQA